MFSEVKILILVSYVCVWVSRDQKGIAEGNTSRASGSTDLKIVCMYRVY